LKLRGKGDQKKRGLIRTWPVSNRRRGKKLRESRKIAHVQENLEGRVDDERRLFSKPRRGHRFLYERCKGYNLEKRVTVLQKKTTTDAGTPTEKKL